jgi:hypothetical protein
MTLVKISQKKKQNIYWEQFAQWYIYHITNNYSPEVSHQTAIAQAFDRLHNTQWEVCSLRRNNHKQYCHVADEHTIAYHEFKYYRRSMAVLLRWIFFYQFTSILKTVLFEKILTHLFPNVCSPQFNISDFEYSAKNNKLEKNVYNTNIVVPY